MDEQVVPTQPSFGLAPVRSLFDARAALSQWLRRNRNPNTSRAYAADLRAYAAWRGLPHAEAAATYLVSLAQAQLNAELVEYSDHLEGLVREGAIGTSSAARKVVAIRSMFRMFRMLGYTDATIEIQGLRVDPMAGRRFWSTAMTRLLLRAADGPEPKQVRDRAMIWLMCGHALRRSEIVGLSMKHLDLEAGTAAVLRKGKLARTVLTLSRQSRAALATWLQIRQTADGDAPLFVSLAPVHRIGADATMRLTGDGLYSILRAYGRAAGVPIARPHLIRAGAITEVYRQTHDLVVTQAFGGHASADTTLGYVRFAEDLQGKAAALASDAMDADADEDLAGGSRP